MPRSVRWIGLFLAGLFTTFAIALKPAPAQPVSEGAFCVAAENSISNPVQARSYGDPHIQTYDGLHYSFQTVGEFILSKSRDSSFEVQTRQGRVRDNNGLSLNTAVAMNVCGHRVAVYIEDPDAIAKPCGLTANVLALEMPRRYRAGAKSKSLVAQIMLCSGRVAIRF
ncbi:MAG: hypothetical protein HC886_08105 [Leptolyngbyaceae cyanobacterium SM1_1_3]|nr:hypothetical protein [Leptolyngbyaceae cyanobacterium SM1_1_3]